MTFSAEVSSADTSIRTWLGFGVDWEGKGGGWGVRGGGWGEGGGDFPLRVLHGQQLPEPEWFRRIQRSGFWVDGVGSMVKYLELRVSCLGSRVSCSGCGVWYLGFNPGV